MRLATPAEIFSAFAIENPLEVWQRDPDAFWELVRADYPELNQEAFNAAMSKIKDDYDKR